MRNERAISADASDDEQPAVPASVVQQPPPSPAASLPEWVDLSRLESDERNVGETIESAMELELHSLDGVALLAMPGNVQIDGAVNDARASAIMSFESSLFSDLRAFRKLAAAGFIAQAAGLGRSMLLAMWKAEICLNDVGFAERVDADQAVSDREVMMRAAHEQMVRRHPGDYDYEAETLADMESDYAVLSRLAHKRKGGANYQVLSAGDGGDATISRDPPGALLPGYGDAIVAHMAVRAAECFMLVVPYLLDVAGVDRKAWDERAETFKETVIALLDKHAAGGYSDAD